MHISSIDKRIRDFDNTAQLVEVFHLWLGHNASLSDKFGSSIRRTEAEKSTTVCCCCLISPQFSLPCTQETSFTMTAVGKTPSLRSSMVAVTFFSCIASRTEAGGWTAHAVIANGACLLGHGFCQPGAALPIAHPLIRLTTADSSLRGQAVKDMPKRDAGASTPSMPEKAVGVGADGGQFMTAGYDRNGYRKCVGRFGGGAYVTPNDVPCKKGFSSRMLR